MTHEEARFLCKVEQFARAKGLVVDYRDVLDDWTIKLHFRDSIDGKHHCTHDVLKAKLRSVNSIEAYADSVVITAARQIENLRELEAEARRKHHMYISTGRGGGKTLLNECLARGYLTPEELKYAVNYIKNDIENAKRMGKIMTNSAHAFNGTFIKDVIFNPPATIVMWNDGTKTVVKAQNDEAFDPEKGLTMAITKKAFGNKGNYFETIKKYTEKYKAAKREVKEERYAVYVPNFGWIKGRKYVRVDGKKVFHTYIYTNDKSEALTWKTIVGAKKNGRGLRNAELIRL